MEKLIKSFMNSIHLHLLNEQMEITVFLLVSIDVYFIIYQEVSDDQFQDDILYHISAFQIDDLLDSLLLAEIG